MALLRGWPLIVVALCALALPGPDAVEGKTRTDSLAPYRGLGTWIDLYSPSFRADPDRLVAALVRRGVHTLFVETGNFRQRADLVSPDRLGRIVEAAHARGIAVVAWYLPSLTDPARDLRRARAAIAFRTGNGEPFDAFSLDIESTNVRNSSERSRRLLELSKQLRVDVGPSYGLGAIIPSPVGMRLLPRYWPHFPYAGLAQIYDVFVPMSYYSYRAHGRAAVTRYVQTSIRIIRQASGDPNVPIHVIGGLADATTPGTAAAFARTAVSCGARGISLYDYDATKRAVWPVLRQARPSGHNYRFCS